MPEVGLGIGRFQSVSGGTPQELLCWFDAQGTRYLTPEERSERLAARLRELGEDPIRFEAKYEYRQHHF